jgi:hypothetical protein
MLLVEDQDLPGVSGVTDRRKESGRTYGLRLHKDNDDTGSLECVATSLPLLQLLSVIFVCEESLDLWRRCGDDPRCNTYTLRRIGNELTRW